MTLLLLSLIASASGALVLDTQALVDSLDKESIQVKIEAHRYQILRANLSEDEQRYLEKSQGKVVPLRIPASILHPLKGSAR